MYIITLVFNKKDVFNMKENLYELTNPQKSILATEQYFSNTNINNISGNIIIQEPVDFELMKKAIHLYVQKNDALRLHFILDEKDTKQYVSDFVPFSIEIMDIDSDELDAYTQALCKIPFDIIDTNLFHFKLFRFPDNTGAVYICLHHIIADAWTLGLYISELMDIYSSLVHHVPVSTTCNPSYLDYICSEKEYTKSPKFIKDEAFWSSVFVNKPDTSSILNYHKSGNAILAKREAFSLDNSLYQKILDFCKKNRCSVFTFLMGIYSLYISKINNMAHNVVIGTPVLNRTTFAEKHMAGMFISMVPFPITLSSQISFLDFISGVNTTQMSIFRHQKYPFQDILEIFRNKFNTSQDIYDISLSYQNVRDNKNSSSIPYSTQWLFNESISESLEIHIYDMDNTGILNIYYDYQTCKFTKKDIIFIHNRILYMIEQVLQNPSIKLSYVEIIPPKEKSFIMDSFNHSYVPFPENRTVHELIDAICEKYPNQMAIVDQNTSINYADLKVLSDKVAYHLIHLGIKPNDCVGLLLREKKIDLIVAILGILKAGACFMAIYPDYPADRISYMLQNSNSKFLITEEAYEKQFKDTPSLLVNSLKTTTPSAILPKCDINQTAYLIYTSGSTGKPKGTMQSHKNLTNFVYSFSHFFGDTISLEDRFLSVTNICFDVSMAEIFTPLFYGACLYLYQDLNYSTVEKLCRYIAENKITFSYFPPTILLDVYEELKQYKNLSFNKLLVGVEPIKAFILKNFYKLNPNMKIINGYGPSETTICCTMYPFDKKINSSSITPIGKPIGNSKIHILNEAYEEVPINCIGEIYVSGNCVGNGYKNNPVKTKENFLYLKDFGRVYKTGDFARWDYDGNIHFIGRKDNQVKYRGYRIDMGEIEATFKSYDFVKNAVVFLDKDSFHQESLVAFLVVIDKTITQKEIRELLAEKLPHYMIPNYIQFVPNFPLTRNGKIDKKKLIAMNLIKKEVHYEKPIGKAQTILVQLFQEVFSKQEIGIQDNFFELGGDSLIAMKIVALASQYDIIISPQDFYTFPTIDLLSKKVEKVDLKNNPKLSFTSNFPFEKSIVKPLDGDILLVGATRFFRGPYFI